MILQCKPLLMKIRLLTMQLPAGKTIKTFCAASFLNDLGSDMIYPVWPLFVTVFLGANMTFLGFLDGLGEAVVSLSQAGSGLLSDRLQKRKAFIWTGYICASVSRIGYTISRSGGQVLPFRVLDRLGKIRAVPRDALLADVSTRETRGSAFGMLRAFDNLGAVCGIVVCIVLFEKLGYKNLFLLAAVPSLVGAALIFFFVKEKKTADIYVRLSLRELPLNLKVFFAGSALFALGSFSYSFLLLFAKESGFTAGFVPVLYLIFTMTASIMSYPFGKLADIMNRTVIIVCAFGLFGVMCSGFIFLSAYEIPLLFVVYGLHRGALEPVQKAFVSDLAPVSRKASILGGYQMMLGVCALFSSVTAGVLWDTFGMTAPFVFSLVTSVCSSVVMLFIHE